MNNKIAINTLCKGKTSLFVSSALRFFMKTCAQETQFKVGRVFVLA